ncbi:MAG: peptide-methionine (S)-S-oxide reductase MsrA [Campylobacterota bacterium]
MAQKKKAYFAAGCFWGVEHYFKKLEGVQTVDSGYMGGKTKNPSYEEVSYGNTGHIEAVEVVYDSGEIDYKALVKYFFEIHDFEQVGGQGPDIGYQYISAIFYQGEEEKKTARRVIETLQKMGYEVATKLFAYSPFYKAESYHQDYYDKKGSTPYCHSYRKIF